MTYTPQQVYAACRAQIKKEQEEKEKYKRINNRSNKWTSKKQ